MNRKKVKALTLILAALLILSAAGCGVQNRPAETAAPAAQLTEFEKTAEGRFGRFADTIKLSTFSTIHHPVTTEYDSSDPTRKSPQENVWVDAYMKYLNIEVDRRIAEDMNALNAVINTSMAAGDLPDFMLINREIMTNLARNGVLKNLSEPYKTYTSTKGRFVKESITSFDGAEGALLTGTLNGEMVGFPMIANMYIDSQVLWVRQDWLDIVNMEAPVTLDDLLNVARAFNEQKPGGENTIGLGATGVMTSLMAPFGALLGVWAKTADGSYEYGYVNENMKDGLLFMRRLYDEGLIKSDFAVTNILGEEVANGIVGMYYAPGWVSVTDIRVNRQSDETAEWVALPIPTLDGKRVQQNTNNVIGNFVVVNKNFAYPEALFMMIELELQTFLEPDPEELVTLNISAEGFPYWDFRIFRSVGRADLDFERSRVISDLLDGKTTDVPPWASAVWNMTKDDVDGARNGRILVYKNSYPIIAQLYKDGYLKGGYQGPLTENMILYQNNIGEALTAEYIKIIMGDDPSLFETAVDAWYSNGGRVITDEVNEYYKSIGL